MASPGSRSFFHKPRVNPPNLATLLHCTQISAINFPPLCRGASLATHRPSFDLPILSLSLSRVPSFLVSFRLTCRWQAFSTAFSSPPSAAYASLRLHSPHCHWQTNLNGSIKSIRSNGTQYPFYKNSRSICISLSLPLSILCFVRLTVSSRGGICKDTRARACVCMGGERVTWDECMAKISANVGIITRADSRLAIVCCNLQLNVRGGQRRQGIVRGVGVDERSISQDPLIIMSLCQLFHYPSWRALT